MSISNYQLIAIDLDGTLLDSHGKLSSRNRESLHRAHERGMKIVLCTGRSFVETRSTLESIGLDLDAAITAGGALITDVASGNTLESQPIEAALAREAAEWLSDGRYAVLWLHDRNTAGDDGYVLDGPRRHAAIDYWLSRSGCVMRPLTDWAAIRHGPLRITILDDDAALRDISTRFDESFAGRMTHNIIDVPAWNFTVLEAFAARVSKWAAIESLCRRWSIPVSATVAVGDDVNDLPMIRNAGLGVAMGNGRPAVKAAAHRTVGRNDDHGVAELLDWLLDSNQAQQHLWLNTQNSKSH